MKVIATYTVLIAVLLLPLFIMAETIVVKTKAPQNKNAVSCAGINGSVFQ